ncbi:MAG: hypothetical protein FJ098_16455 [Deltaproteobacteria bacterium]|nr:hypothetical protein [Deltaproteobacteria bacterium]
MIRLLAHALLVVGLVPAGALRDGTPRSVDARCRAAFSKALVSPDPATLDLAPERLAALGAKEVHPYAKRFPRILLYVLEYGDAKAATAHREEALELMERWGLVQWGRTGLREELVLVVGLEGTAPAPDALTREILDRIAKIFGEADDDEEE